MVLGEMKVRRVEDERGSHIEPPLDTEWSPLTRLRWCAAVAEVDCDRAVRISVNHGISSTNGIPRDEFCVSISGPGSSIGFSSSPLEVAWTLINGLSAGARAAKATPGPEGTPIFDRLRRGLGAMV